MPLDQEGLRDYLNAANAFLPLYVDDRLALINPEYVVSVHETSN